MARRKTPDDYHAMAEKRGYRWLGPEVDNGLTPTWWSCEKGHNWEARYNSLNQGTGCPYCSEKALKRPPDYHLLAKRRGYRWLGPEVKNNKTDTWWECRAGHKWQARYSHINQGKSCPDCHLKRNKKAMAKYHGWTNYQTWCLYTWLTSDYDAYTMITSKFVGVENKHEAMILRLRNYVYGLRVVLPDTGLMADLLDDAVDQIDYDEIAKSLLEE